VLGNTSTQKFAGRGVCDTAVAARFLVPSAPGGEKDESASGPIVMRKTFQKSGSRERSGASRPDSAAKEPRGPKSARRAARPLPL
jgi:hypothetical protein